MLPEVLAGRGVVGLPAVEITMSAPMGFREAASDTDARDMPRLRKCDLFHITARARL